jgi:hypothetical protein
MNPADQSGARFTRRGMLTALLAGPAAVRVLMRWSIARARRRRSGTSRVAAVRPLEWLALSKVVVSDRFGGFWDGCIATA